MRLTVRVAGLGLMGERATYPENPFVTCAYPHGWVVAKELKLSYYSNATSCFCVVYPSSGSSVQIPFASNSRFWRGNPHLWTHTTKGHGNDNWAAVKKLYWGNPIIYSLYIYIHTHYGNS